MVVDRWFLWTKGRIFTVAESNNFDSGFITSRLGRNKSFADRVACTALLLRYVIYSRPRFSRPLRQRSAFKARRNETKTEEILEWKLNRRESRGGAYKQFIEARLNDLTHGLHWHANNRSHLHQRWAFEAEGSRVFEAGHDHSFRWQGCF